MKFDNLIELDVSYNKLKEIELSHKTFPSLAVLNLCKQIKNIDHNPV